MQVTQQAEAAASGLVEEVVVEPLWLLIPLLAVAVHEGPQLLRMGVALLRQRVADVVDADFGSVAGGYLTEARMRSGNPGPLPSPKEALAYLYTSAERLLASAYRSMQVVGAPRTYWRA